MTKPAQIPFDHLDSIVRFLRRSLRFWYVSLLVIALGAAATVAVAKYRPKAYRSDAVVHYREGLQWSGQEGIGGRRVAQRLKDFLLARAELATMVQDLNLSPRLVKAGRLGDAIEEVRLRINFKVADGDIYVISYTGDTPEEAQRVTAKLTAMLLEENNRSQSEQAKVTTAFLEQEKKRLAADLAAKERELARFVARYPEFAQETGTMGAMVRAQTRAAAEPALAPSSESTVAALEREEQRLREELAATGAGNKPDPLVAAKNDAEARLRAAEHELALRRERFTENHPDVVTAAAAVREAEAAYRRASGALVASGTVATSTKLQARLAELKRQIADAQRREAARVRPPPADKRRTEHMVTLDTDWARLNREVNEARERFAQLDNRQFTAAMVASTTSSGRADQITVIDPAFLPSQPIGIRPSRLYAMCMGLAFVIAIGLAMLLALLDDRVYESADVERLDLAPVLLDVSGRGLLVANPRGPSSGETNALPSSPPLRFLPEPGSTDPRRERGNGTIDIDVARASRSGSSEEDAGTGGNSRGPTTAIQVVPGAGAAPLDRLLLDYVFEVDDRDARRPAPRVRAEEAPSPRGGIVRVERVAAERDYDPRLLMLAAPESPAAARFRVLRHRLSERPGVSTILVTSPQPGEGKTVCAANLALALGESGRARVILLEVNFRTPSLARLLRFEPLVCFGDQLEAHRAVPEQPWIVMETFGQALHAMVVAPGGSKRPVLDAFALSQCIIDLRAAGYDYVVIDSGPVLDSADVNVIEECVDAVLVTVREGQSRGRVIRDAVEQIGSKKLVGVALVGT